MNTPSLNEINKISIMDPNLLTRHYKLKLMNDFMNIKYQNPRLKQSEIADQLKISSSTLQRVRNDINMQSPYRNNPNNVKKRSKNVENTDFDNNLHDKTDVERPRMTSNDFKRPQRKSNESSRKIKTKNNSEGGSAQENIESNEHYLDKILKNNNS